MTKLIYNGVMAVGRYKTKYFEQVVKKGEKYEVPANLVEEFLKSGDWKKSESKEKSKVVEKVEEVSTIADEEVKEEFSDTKKESTYGGNNVSKRL